MITDFPRFFGETTPSALSRRKSESARPPRANPPARRKLRRENPSQNRSRPPLKNVSIGRLECNMTAQGQQQKERLIVLAFSGLKRPKLRCALISTCKGAFYGRSEEH